MAIKTGSLGPLLQGVSQQPSRVRLEGQVEEQINMHSDVTRGLTSRPGAVRVNLLSSLTSLNYTDIEFGGQSYILGYNSSTLLAWTLNGVSVPVSFVGGANAYLGTDMRFHVVDTNLIVLNRNKVVTADPATPAPNRNLGVVQIRGGEFSRQYVIRVTFIGTGISVLASYSTPDGTNSGDGLNSQSIQIAISLMDALTASPDWPTAASIVRYHDSLAIYHPTAAIRLDPGDGTGGNTVVATTDTVRTVADLPKYAPNGMLVQVKVSAATEDNYWLRFNAKATSSVSGTDGFGSEGIWEEWRNPYIVESFNLSTMPHFISREGGTLVMRRTNWLRRQVGDGVTAPFPSVRGKTIRDIGGFEGRLVLLTPNSVVMSRTNYPYDFWRESATVISATDPIDITSTKKNDLKLDWIVPFDKDLFIVADPGDSQFVIRGGGLDPNNAGMVLTTEYEIKSGGCSPASTGRTLLFPYTVGQWSGVQEFYTSGDNSAQAANGLTETVNKYIPGLITQIEISQNFNLAIMGADGFTNGIKSADLFVYKYLWDGQELIQSSWSKWRFGSTVAYHFFRAARLYIIINRQDGATLEYMDLNRPNGPYGYPISMDSVANNTVLQTPQQALDALNNPDLATTYVDRSLSGNVKFIQHTGCPNPGLPVIIRSTSNLGGGVVRYLLDAKTAPPGATVIGGQAFIWELHPTEAFARDYQQRIDTSKNLTIQEWTVNVKDSGPFSADFNTPYGSSVTYNDEIFPLNKEPMNGNQAFLYTGDIIVPWGERSDWSSLRLWGDDYRPVTILEVQWAGQIISPRGTRV